jgi:hypothetical protein
MSYIYDIRSINYDLSLTIFISIFFLFSFSGIFITFKALYDLLITFITYNSGRKHDLKIFNSIGTSKRITVAIVIPVFNDFMERESSYSFQQKFSENKYIIKPYILDDSTDEKQIEMINNYAKSNNITILRQTKENRDKYGSGCGLAAAFNYFIEQTKDE